jgi:hypothetical protein
MTATNVNNQNIAIGLTGEPVPLGIGNGAMVSMHCMQA